VAVHVKVVGKDSGLQLRLTVPAMAFTHAWVGLASGATGFFVAAVAGYGLGYCAYEVLHWVHHSTDWASRARPGAWLRQKEALHEHHHFRAPGFNYGFVTSLWDRLLGTYRAA
jgi:sterol desaturase/sphingolipid hydroxylase (fatty acid hydroxylase superfamily)